MNPRLATAVLMCTSAASHAADPRDVWDQMVKAKGGRERLHAVHSLAVYMKSAGLNLGGAATTWLCVFPDRYFEFDGAGSHTQRALAVDRTANRSAEDATGHPRAARHLSFHERDQLVLNQLLFLLESAWQQPDLVAVEHNALVVQAAGRTYKLFLDKQDLPQRILSPPIPGQKPKIQYDYRLQHYRDFDGIMLPTRVTSIGDSRQADWEVDYEVDAKYNPKLFERMPDLANGPEPWRQR